MEVQMNSGINFDIMYELACGRVVVVTPPDNQGRKSTYYWVSDNGNLIQYDSAGSYYSVGSINIPWRKGYRFSVEERDFKNTLTNH